jgi:hypothetical protein
MKPKRTFLEVISDAIRQRLEIDFGPYLNGPDEDAVYNMARDVLDALHIDPFEEDPGS